MSKLTKEKLIEIGVNPDNLIYECGELNIIVQCFGLGDDEKNKTKFIENPEIYPDVYMPRKNRVYSDTLSIKDKEDKKDWINHLKDSAERLKIISYYLSEQAAEIEKYGYPITTCCYPE